MSALQRIEQLTSAYESCAFVLRMQAQAIEDQHPGEKAEYSTEGPITHANAFRDHVKEIGNDFGKFDIERYLPLHAGQLTKFGMISNAPVEIASWSAFSRRIYAPTLDAQTILCASKLDNVKWADVQWPLGAFVIELAEPFIDPRGETYDTVMVFRERPIHDIEETEISEEQFHRTERFLEERGDEIMRMYGTAMEKVGTDIVMIRLLGPSLERAIVTRKERDKLYDLLRIASSAQQSTRHAPDSDSLKKTATKAWYKFWKNLGEVHDRNTKIVLPYFPISIDRHGDLPVTASVDALRRSMLSACPCGKPSCYHKTEHPELDRAAQLVVGLCLYLRTATRPERPLVSAWEPHPLIGQIPQRPVTTGAVRCEVRAARPFTQDERDRILGRGDYKQGKHAAITWTKAYDRRPMGQGKNPDAPRTVRIESYPSLHWYSKDPETQEERSSAPISLV